VKFVISLFWDLLKEKPSLIFCGHMNLSGVCVFFSRFFKVPYILLTYGIDVWGKNDGRRERVFEEAGLIVTMSAYTASWIKVQAPSLPENKIIILPAFVDAQKFFPIAKPKALADKLGLEGRKVILTVSRLTAIEVKGYDKVIRALPSIIKEIPEAVYLLVGGGPDIPRIKRLAQDLNLTEYVKIVDFIARDDLNPYYNLCDVFVMPSKQEGFGIVYLEALAAGKPVVAGNKDGSREALCGGALGFLVDPDNVPEIAETVCAILKGRVAGPRLLDAVYLRESVISRFGETSFRQNLRVVLNACDDIVNP
jgi:glycosyltransferase involved in cell wall biosynthesis